MLLVVGLSVLGPWTAGTYADQAFVTLLTTSIKTDDSWLSIPLGSTTNAFTPTSVSCPLTQGSCTIRVEVSTVLNLQGQAVIVMGVLVDGSPTGVSPAGTVFADLVALEGEQRVGARTFSWMKNGVLPGIHTVQVTFSTAFGDPSGNQLAQARTLTIQVYQGVLRSQ
jgi:hypothetical protein